MRAQSATRASVSVGLVPPSEAHAGRSYPPTPIYEITAAKIAEFAAALGDDNPAYKGDSPLAPPTLVATIAFAAWDQMFTDPDLELELRRIIHADQRFSYVRPLRAGDRVTATLTIDKVRTRGTTEMLSCSIAVHDVAGDLTCTAASTLLHSRDAA
jgi:acyl dehydratase